MGFNGHFTEGLKQGEIAPVVELSSQDGHGCASHRIRNPLQPIGTQKLCTLSAPKADGRVTEMCIDVAHPERHEVREAPAKLARLFRHKMKEQGSSGDAPKSMILDPKETKCVPPEGPYTDNCLSKVESVVSTDSNVPDDLCKLTAYCATDIPSTRPVENEFYYPDGSPVVLGNKKGILTILKGQGEEIPISKIQKVECKPLQGTHEFSCDIKVKPYASSDPKLDGTFCEMTSTCKDVKGSSTTQTTVYYRLAHVEEGIAVENCDSKLVVHHSKTHDGMCSGKDPAEIKDIAEKIGKSRHVLSKTDEIKMTFKATI